MTYFQFIHAVETKVKKEVEEEKTVSIHTNVKNNGVRRSGIMISEKGINISPTIYLEEYFHQFRMGYPLEQIAKDIVGLYEKIRFQNSWEDGEKVKDYEFVKDKIIYRLIGREENQELLKEIPYKSYLDLAIIYYVLLEVCLLYTSARTGRPGPVLIDLPKDVMGELGSAEYPDEVNIRGYKPNTHVHVGQLKRAVKMLSKAKKPLFLAGGGINIAHANEEFTKLVDMTNVPVVTTVMGRGAVPTTHPLYIGNLGMHGAYACNMAVNECDLLFSIGTRFNDRITGKLHSFAPNAQIVHIDIDTAAISKNVQVDVPIVADAKEAVTKMLEYVTPCETGKWLDTIEDWKAEHPLKMKKKPIMTPQDVIEAINRIFDEAIIVTDVGQHQMFTAQFIEITEKKKLLMSGGLGTMGYGMPGAIGAKIGNPDTPVISISGDGGFQMNSQELATAVLEELPIISCIFNNNNLGMVRQWQKLFYGKRYSMTCLRSGAACRGKCGEVECPVYTPDFMKLADAYGAKGIHITKKEEIEPAFREAMKSTKTPYILEFDIDPEDLVYPMVKPGGTLEDLIMDC